MAGPSILVKSLLIAGLALIITGLIIWFAGNKFHWLGKLPGDIRIEREGFHLYIPVSTMLLISLVLSFIAWVVKKYFM